MAKKSEKTKGVKCCAYRISIFDYQKGCDKECQKYFADSNWLSPKKPPLHHTGKKGAFHPFLC